MYVYCVSRDNFNERSVAITGCNNRVQVMSVTFSVILMAISEVEPGCV